MTNLTPPPADGENQQNSGTVGGAPGSVPGGQDAKGTEQPAGDLPPAGAATSEPGRQAGAGGSVPPDAPTGPGQPAGAGAPAPGQSDAARLGTRAVAITATVIGAGALLFAGTGAAFSAVSDTLYVAQAQDPGADGTISLDASVAGVTDVDIDHSFGSMRVRFDDVSRAELEATGTNTEWRFERKGDTLVVRRHADGIGWGDWSWFGSGWGADRRATLTLPESIAGVDLDIDTGAGDVLATGEFGEVAFDMGAGSVEIEGTAESVEGEIGAGQAILELADVRALRVDVSAGDLQASLTGEAPEIVRLEVSAGGADVTLPDVPYDLRQDVSAGDIETHDLEVSSRSENVIDARVSAGGIELRAD
ncbi:hypothetical protein [Microbacterium halotolerans]|uniref:hypothetical protein n=1 Tax=Microbacterium halotolerans TaxID=246613 RepID=UPI000E6ABA4A|nr:hypothetical protein [Microbacterium halotolerans]